MSSSSYSRRYLPEFVYGSIDGTVTTFAIISAVSGAGLAPSIILVLGLANVLADGFSMASSNFLSQQSNDDAGFPGNSGKKPLKTAIVTFLSFVIVGIIPVLPFVYTYSFLSAEQAFKISIISTAVVFFLIGFIRGRVSHKHPLRTALETLFVGAVASVIAYLAGLFLKGIV